MTDPQDEDLKRVEAALQTLSEYFDCVHIFASRHESGTHDGTVHCDRGSGHWFGRYGQIKEWMIRQDELEQMLNCLIEAQNHGLLKVAGAHCKNTVMSLLQMREANRSDTAKLIEEAFRNLVK